MSGEGRKAGNEAKKGKGIRKSAEEFKCKEKK